MHLYTTRLYSRIFLKRIENSRGTFRLPYASRNKTQLLTDSVNCLGRRVPYSTKICQYAFIPYPAYMVTVEHTLSPLLSTRYNPFFVRQGIHVHTNPRPIQGQCETQGQRSFLPTKDSASTLSHIVGEARPDAPPDPPVTIECLSYIPGRHSLFWGISYHVGMRKIRRCTRQPLCSISAIQIKGFYRGVGKSDNKLVALFFTYQCVKN